MTKYNTLNVKLSNSQLNKLKSEIKNGTEITLNLSSNLTGTSNDETNFQHKLILTNTQNFVKLLEMVYQLIEIFGKLSCLRLYNQEVFFVTYQFRKIFYPLQQKRNRYS